VPLHSDIVVRARNIGFDNLTPILWHKIANANYELPGSGGFLGKPFEPNAIIKNDIEYILMLRKPGGYRSPSLRQRQRSRLSREEHGNWFRPIWDDISGESTRNHPAPFPVSLAYRLVRMFSFNDDTVLDPFAGTFTTGVAAMQAGRHSVGNELDAVYFADGLRRLRRAAHDFNAQVAVLRRQCRPAGEVVDISNLRTEQRTFAPTSQQTRPNAGRYRMRASSR
jgi:site-specific DNA-methyltransferase (adenine-specific)